MPLNSATPLFECLMCGHCCKGYGGTYLTEADIDAIAKFIGVSTQTLIAEYTSSSGDRRVLAQGPDDYCIFWDQLCTIHPVKPLMCRNWPHIKSILIDVRNWHAMATSCPGMRTDVDDGTILEMVRQKLNR